MKKVIAGLVLLIVIAVGLVFLLPLVIPRDAVKTRVAEEISGWTGRSVSVSGEPTIKFFPRPTVTLNDVRISGPSDMENADLATMAALTGKIGILPLIIGEIDIDDFQLSEPSISLIIDEDGRENWIFDTSAAALHLAFSGDVPLGDFSVDNGTITFENRQTGRTEVLSDVNLAVDWTSVRRPLAVSGEASWRNEIIAATINASQPFDFLRGQDTPLNVSLGGQPFSISLAGQASNIRDAQFAGNLAFDSSSLGAFLQWLGTDADMQLGLGPMKLNGQARLSNTTLEMTELRIGLDGNEADGALRLDFGADPVVSGTLAYERLDLSPYLAGFSDKIAADGEEWRDIELDANWLRQIDADVRVSADTLLMPPMEFDKAAVTLRVIDGSLDLGIGQSNVLGGELSGTVTVTDRDTGLTADTRLRAEGFTLADASLFGLPDGFKGIATATADLTTNGQTFGELADALRGTITLSAKNGVVPNFALSEAAEAVADGEANSSFLPLTNTDFDLLETRLVLQDDDIDVASSQLTGDGFVANLKGQVAVAKDNVDLQGQIEAKDDDAAAPIRVSGPLNAPIVTVDEVAEKTD